MIKINLLPTKAAKKKERILSEVIIGVLIIALAVVGLSVRYVSQVRKIEDVEKNIRTTEQKIQQLQEAKKKYEELLKKSKILEQQLQAIDDLEQNRDWFIRVLDKITESVPRKQVWITSLTYGGGKGGENSINASGKSYDKDAIAHFMGNLSIISCDDELPDEEKAEICRKRNNRCRRWNDEEGHWEWDFEGCRRFYRSTCDKAKTCGGDVSACENTMRHSCSGQQKSGGDCNDIKEKCQQLKEECNDYKQGCDKLLEKMYIVYDSIDLKYIKLGKGSGGGVEMYTYELSMDAANPSKK